MKKRNRGFTLIELLVVIAIIGILSAVVLASLNTARQKGKDAAIQSDLSAAATEAEIYYSNNRNYGPTDSAVCTADMWTGTQMYKALLAAAKASGSTGADDAAKLGNTDFIRCYVTAADTDPVIVRPKFAVQVKLTAPQTSTASDYWCVDSSGLSKRSTALITASSCD